MTRAEQMIEDLKQTSGLIAPTTMDPYAPKPKRDALLVTREATHGSFSENARVSQAIKTLLVQSDGYDKINNVQREALDLIATKIGRILSGNPSYRDHWDDIAGYAKLGSEACA